MERLDTFLTEHPSWTKSDLVMVGLHWVLSQPDKVRDEWFLRFRARLEGTVSANPPSRRGKRGGA